jgi:hypothetical protein
MIDRPQDRPTLSDTEDLRDAMMEIMGALQGGKIDNRAAGEAVRACERILGALRGSPTDRRIGASAGADLLHIERVVGRIRQQGGAVSRPQ